MPGVYEHMSTGGSSSRRRCYIVMRQAGAQARETLVAAAAEVWKVESADCRALEGQVVHLATGRRLGYGELAERASHMLRLNLQSATLKDPKQFRIIGKPIPGQGNSRKVDGRTRYGFDVRVPDMLYAVVDRSPVVGGRPKHYDASAARVVRACASSFRLSRSQSRCARPVASPNDSRANCAASSFRPWIVAMSDLRASACALVFASPSVSAVVIASSAAASELARFLSLSSAFSGLVPRTAMAIVPKYTCANRRWACDHSACRSSRSKAGLRPGDVINAVNGISLKDEDFHKKIAAYKPGSTVRLGYMRDSWAFEASLTVGAITR